MKSVQKKGASAPFYLVNFYLTLLNCQIVSSAAIIAVLSQVKRASNTSFLVI